MKLPFDHCGLRIANCGLAQRIRRHDFTIPRSAAAFTLIEIALSLAIIGFALTVILGVLPFGMNTQRDNREETIINQDATVLIEAIRSGAVHSDYLTNYVYAITNYSTYFDTNGVPGPTRANGYTFNGVQINTAVYPVAPYSSAPITNGANIIGLLSTPEFVANDFPTNNFPPVPGWQFAADHYGVGCYSNRVVAYVRSISGLAVEKPPQNNQIMREDTLTYRLLSVNAPIPVSTNYSEVSPFARQLAASQRELRLTFLWPQRPNGGLGGARQSFRTTIAGQLAPTNFNYYPNQWLYFYRSQSFTNTP
jgi:type II secretory pathway pseudopilin PulG